MAADVPGRGAVLHPLDIEPRRAVDVLRNPPTLNAKRGEDEQVVSIAGHVFTVGEVREMLREQGLHVVTAAEKEVLDAAASLHPRSLKRPLQYVGDWEEFIEAELARREAAK